jgi:general secretion pathway protein A
MTALVIDEVQAMPDELLEEVRLLANLETSTEKLLPIVLSGQPELADRLNQQSLRQLKQRVSLRCELGPLDERETAEYVAGRIRIAGGNSVLVFTRQAVERIYKHSMGIPRLISVICDNALISGFAADRRPVDSEIVADVCRDFDLAHKSEIAAVSTPAVAKVEPQKLPAPEPRKEPAPERPEGKGLFEHFNVRRRFSLF